MHKSISLIGPVSGPGSRITRRLLYPNSTREYVGIPTAQGRACVGSVRPLRGGAECGACMAGIVEGTGR